MARPYPSPALIMQSALICGRTATDQRGLHDQREKWEPAKPRSGEVGWGGGEGCQGSCSKLSASIRRPRRRREPAEGPDLQLEDLGEPAVPGQRVHARLDDQL